MTFPPLAVAVAAAQPDPAWGFGLGGAMFVLGATAFWPALHLRFRTLQRLRTPVELAFAGLAERAVERLRKLHTELEALLPDPAAPFDPLEVIADPASVARSAKLGVRVLKERDTIHTRFTWLLRMCSLLKYFSAAFLLLVAAATAAYFFAFSTPALWNTLAWIAAFVAVTACVIVTVYAVLDSQILRSIEDSDPIDSRERPATEPAQ